MSHFIYFTSFHSFHGKNKNSQLTSLPMCGFIAQLVEHRTGIAEVTGSNPVEALIFFFFFRLLHSNCLNWKFTAKIIYHPLYTVTGKSYGEQTSVQTTVHPLIVSKTLLALTAIRERKKAMQDFVETVKFTVKFQQF